MVVWSIVLTPVFDPSKLEVQETETDEMGKTVPPNALLNLSLKPRPPRVSLMVCLRVVSTKTASDSEDALKGEGGRLAGSHS
jgi:hypothetical protein